MTGLGAPQLTDATLLARAELGQIVEALRRSARRWAGLRWVASAEHIGVREGRRVRGRDTVTREGLVAGRGRLVRAGVHA